MSEIQEIQEVTLNDLDPRLRKQVENAQKSMERNPTYTIDVCTGILQRNPGCLEVRQLLRQAQHRAKGSKTSGLTKFLGNVTNAPFAIKAGSQMKKDPVAVLDSSEKMITANPGNVTAYKTLAQAAEALALWDTAVFAHEDIKKLEPNNLDNRVALASALLSAGRAKDAIAEGDAILRDNPGHEAAADIVRKASVAESMQRGKWEEEGDFRDKLADEEKSIELEQASRVVNDEEVLGKLIEKNKKLIEDEPEALNYYREIINAYRQLSRWEDALEWVKKARQTENGRSDPTLERQVGELKVQSMKQRIAEMEEAGESGEELEKLKAELHQYRLENARQLVEKYPNDYTAKYELGCLLVEDEDYDAAIQEFQLSLRNPKIRTKALLSLGRAYMHKEFYDMAVEQLSLAKKEIPLMGDLKKEAIYELAHALELMGNEDEAIAEYKVIYQNDIGYRDVAEKINSFYANRRKK